MGIQRIVGASALVALLSFSGCSDSGPTNPDPLIEQPSTSSGGGGGGGGGDGNSSQAGQLKACFTTTPDPPVIEDGDRIRLDGRCSKPRGRGTTYKWDLGDGRRKTGVFIEPPFRTPGNYTVSLTVRDGTRSDTTSKTVRVEAGCPPEAKPSDFIETDPAVLCMRNGDTAIVQVANLSDDGIRFTASDTRVVDVKGNGSFAVNPDECVNFGLNDIGLFPGGKCDISVKASCSSGTAANLRITARYGGQLPGEFSDTYLLPLTCNP